MLNVPFACESFVVFDELKRILPFCIKGMISLIKRTLISVFNLNLFLNQILEILNLFNILNLSKKLWNNIYLYKF
jgi:hypothetical protein